jgi:PAS domain S-box-containing protein
MGFSKPGDKFPLYGRLQRILTAMRCSYALAIMLVLIAYLARALFLGGLGAQAPFITFYPAVVVAALYGGLGPGLLATVLSALAVDYFWMGPAGFGVGEAVDWLSMHVFVGAGALISAASHVTMAARTRRATAEGDARAAVERQRAAAALSEVDDRFRLLVEGVRDCAIIMLDGEGRVTSWNSAAQQIMGYAAEDILGQPFTRLYTPEDRGRDIPAQALAAARERGDLTAEGWRERKDGSRFWAEVTLTALHDPDGRIRGYAKLTRDMTQRRQTEQQLRELSQRLNYHVDHSPLAVIEWGPGMRLTRWSGEAERIFGWTAQEVLGKGMHDFRWIHEDDRASVRKVEAGLQVGKSPGRFSSNRNYHKDGSIVHCEWYNSSLLDDSGKMVSVLSLVLDVTQRTRAEELLRQANAELERRVAERTSQLAAANRELRAQMAAYERLEAEIAGRVEAERVRLGMELHDNLCQQIAATGMLASFLAKRVREQPAPVPEMADRIVVTLGQAGTDAHKMARGLLPVHIEPAGLMVALEALVQQTQQMQGVACTFRCEAPVPVENTTTATYLFRIAQEAIHNAITHGLARAIVVTLAGEPRVSLAI